MAKPVAVEPAPGVTPAEPVAATAERQGSATLPERSLELAALVGNQAFCGIIGRQRAGGPGSTGDRAAEPELPSERSARTSRALARAVALRREERGPGQLSVQRRTTHDLPLPGDGSAHARARESQAPRTGDGKDVAGGAGAAAKGGAGPAAAAPAGTGPQPAGGSPGAPASAPAGGAGAPAAAPGASTAGAASAPAGGSAGAPAAAAAAGGGPAAAGPAPPGVETAPAADAQEPGSNGHADLGPGAAPGGAPASPAAAGGPAPAAPDAGKAPSGIDGRGEISSQSEVRGPRAADVSERPPAEAMRAGGEAALQQLTGAATAPKPTPDGPPEAGPESEPLDVKAPPAPETAAVATDALAKRDEAVAAVDAREGDAGGAALASTPVQFAPVAIEGATAEETAAAEQQRAQAAAMVSEFLGTVATKSDEAAAAGAQVPGRMKAAASASVDAIAGSVEEHTAEIAGRVARLRAQVQGKAAAARGTVAGRHAATTNAVRAATSASRETIGTAYATSLKTIDDLVTAQLRTVDDRYRDGDKRFRDAGKKVGGEAAARGSEMAADYMRGLRDVDDSFLDGPLTYRKGEARANAAREVSKAYDKGLQEEADKQADEAVKGKPHDVESVQTTARQAREALKAQHTAILTTLADAEASALRQADEARTRLNASIAQALAGAEQTLAGQEASLVDNLRATARTQSAAVEQQATEVAGALQGQVDKAVGGLRETGAALAAQAQGQVAPPLDELAGSLSAASAQLDGAVGELRAGLERGQGGAEQQLAEAVSTVSGGLASSSQTGLEGAANTASEVGTSIGAIGASAASTFGGILSSHQQTTAQTATSATEGFKGATDGVKKSYEAMSTGLQAGFEKNAKGLEDGLRGALPKMETEIRTQADEAASHVAPRWKSIVKWVLIIAVIVVVALVIGPFVIGAVGAALGTGAIMTGIIAGAIVGAATSATIQVINNWAENRPLGEGVMRAAIVGAIGGAVGGGFGAYFAGLGQAGNAVANTAFRQFALNTVTGVATENIINLATGQWSWESFGMSLLTNIAIGGAMHVASGAKPIAGIQERSMGAGQRFGGSIRATVTGVGPINVQPGEPVPSGRAGTPEEPVPGGRAATPEEPVPGGRAGTPEEPVPGGRTGTPEEPVPGGRTGTPEEPVPGGRPTTEEPGARPATAEGGEPVAGGKPGATEAETPVKVGDTPHEVKLRNGPDGPEVWACSQVCGPLKGKIDDMLPHVEDPKVRAELELLKAKAGQLEADIAAGKYPEPGDRLAAVRDLGDQLKAIGVVEPKVGVLLEGGPDFGKLGVEVGEPIVIKPSEAGSLDLPEGSKVLYVVRDKNTGQILKVGETTAGGPLEARFDRYRLAGERLNVDVEIEVRPVTLPEGQGIRGPEQLLRDQVDIGTSLPWDNTVLEGLGPRLGRGGPGTPFEPLPGGSRLREEGWYWNEKGELVPPGGGPPPAFRRSNAPPPENEVRDILAKAGGKVTKAADDAGVSVQTIYNWMKRYGLKAGDFK